MKNFKNLFKLCIAFVLAVGLAACSSGKNQKDSGSESPNITTEKISIEDARSVAFEHATVDPSDATVLSESGDDYGKGKAKYELEFAANGEKYDYEIDSYTGKVLKWEKEPLEGDDIPKNLAVNQAQQGSTSQVKNGDSSTPNDAQSTAPKQAPAAAITLEDAKSKALSHFEVKATDAIFENASKDVDDGREVYEIEFKANGIEYYYEIDANTGEVIKAEKDVD